MALPGVVCAIPTAAAYRFTQWDLCQQIREDRRIAVSVGGDLNGPNIERFRIDPDMHLALQATSSEAGTMLYNPAPANPDQPA